MNPRLLPGCAIVLRRIALAGALVVLIGQTRSLDQRALAQSNQDKPSPARARATIAKPERSVLSTSDRPDVLVVKFHEGTKVRLRGGLLTAADARALSAQETRRRERVKLDDATIMSDLATVNSFVAGAGYQVDRLFGRPEEALEAEQQRGETRLNEELADLNLYYLLTTANPDRAAAEVLLDRLNELDSVERAYAESELKPSGDIAPPTPDFTAEQDWLGVWGIDADYAYSRNARGQGVKIIDVEGNWDFAHEDVPPMFTKWGYPFGSDYKEHGTAVLGVLAAGDNGYGMRGIAPSASVGAAAYRFYYPGTNILLTSIARAIDEAAARLGPGDVILIELQRSGPDSGLDCPCGGGCDDFEYVPVEYKGADFDAIRHATATHVVVVEAAGNGSMNLDDPRYGGRFDRNVRDSGAIIVGASTGPLRNPSCSTNYGSRVDVQGWGGGVATLGKGDLAKVNGSDQRQWYRSSFGGTSAASAMVAGAAAAFQSALIARGLPRLFPEEMQYVMVKVGYAQGTSPKHIGPLPALRPLIRAYEDGDTCQPIVIRDTPEVWSTFVPPFGRRQFCFGVTLSQTISLNRYVFETCANPQYDTRIEVISPIGLVGSNNNGCGINSRASRLVIQPTVVGTHRVTIRGNANATGDLIFRFYRRPPDFEPGE
jgi:serine protease